MHGGGAHRLRRCCLGTLLEHHIRPDAGLHEPLDQLAIVDVPVAEGLAPDIARGLPQVQLRNARPVEFDDVEQCHLGMAGAAVDPVGVETQAQRAGVGRQHHVMEFPSGMLQFNVVVVVRQGDPDGCQLVPQLVQRGGLGLQLLVALSLAIRKRAGIGHDDPRSQPPWRCWPARRSAPLPCRLSRGRPECCRYRSTATPNRAS